MEDESHGSLGALFRLDPDALALAQSRLDELMAEPASEADEEDQKAIERQKEKDDKAIELVGILTDPAKLACASGLVADFSPVIAGCTRGNAMICALGAGTGSKATALYQIKYMAKDSTSIAPW